MKGPARRRPANLQFLHPDLRQLPMRPQPDSSQRKKIAVGVVGCGRLNLFQPLPEAGRRPRVPAPARPKPRSAGRAAKDGSLPGPHHRRQQFPAGERLARSGQVAARHAGFPQQVPAIPPAVRAIFWNSVSGSSVTPSSLSTDRCDSTSNRRMDSTWSPNRSMRTGFGVFGREHIQDAAAHGILAHHLHRLAPLVADALQMRTTSSSGTHRPYARRERELPIEIRPAAAASMRRRRPATTVIGARCVGQAPQAKRALLQDFGVRRHALKGQDVERGEQSAAPVSRRGISRS